MITAAQRWIPPWLRGYDTRSLIADMVAGLVLSVLLVPQAMAFALLAGLPPEAGLYTALVAPLLYAVVGQCGSVSVGPVALCSLLVADAIGGVDVPALEAAAVVGLESGLLLTALGVCRLGRLVNFISEPALLGFMAAAAVLIAVSQMPAFLGVDAGSASNLVGTVTSLVSSGTPDLATVSVGAGCLAALVVGGRLAGPFFSSLGLEGSLHLALSRSVPLIVMVTAAVVATVMSLDVTRVTEPAGGLPSVRLPMPAVAVWVELLVPSFVIAVIAFVQGTAVAKSIPSPTQRRLDTSREALGIGTANIAAGLAGGYAVGVSLSRSALVHDAGGRTPLAAVVGALAIVPVLWYLAPWLATLPEAALAALVISAVASLVKVDDIRDILRQSRAEGAVIALTVIATLVLGVRVGLLVGAVAGLATFLWVSSVPRITALGRTDRPGIYRSIERDGIQLDTLPVLVLRIDRELYFGNAAYAEDRIDKMLSKRDDARAVLFDMRAVNDVDATAGRMLRKLVERLRAADLAVGFAIVQEPVHEELKLALPQQAVPISLTVEEGIDTLRSELDRIDDRDAEGRDDAA